MEAPHFHYGDILIHQDDNSRWRFIRYVVDKITTRASDAPSTGGGGSRTWLRAVPLAEGENEQEQELRASLFTKE